MPSEGLQTLEHLCKTLKKADMFISWLSANRKQNLSSLDVGICVYVAFLLRADQKHLSTFAVH